MPTVSTNRVVTVALRFHSFSICRSTAVTNIERSGRPDGFNRDVARDGLFSPPLLIAAVAPRLLAAFRRL
jgi:hypothetical protein